jgi:WD40 repeat protein
MWELAFSASGKRLAATSMEGSIGVWTVATGEQRWFVQHKAKNGEDGWLAGFRFIDEDRLLAVGWDTPKVQLWDTEKGELTRVWEVDEFKRSRLKSLGPGGKFADVSLSPSGKQMAWLVVPSPEDKAERCTALVYETATGKFLRGIKGLQAPAERITLLDEGETLLLQTCPGGRYAEEGRLAVIDATSGKTRFHFKFAPSELSMFLPWARYARVITVSPARKWLVTSDSDWLHGYILWDLATGKALHGCTQQLPGVAFTPDGKRAVVALGARLSVCNDSLRSLRLGQEATGSATVHFLRDGRLVAECSRRDEGRCSTWDAATGILLDSCIRPAVPQAQVYTPHDQDALGRLFVYRLGQTVVVHDCLRDRLLCRLPGVEDPQMHLRMSADGRRVFVASWEKGMLLIRWFDSRRGHELGRYHVALSELHAVFLDQLSWLSEEGDRFGYLTSDRRLAVVDCQRGKVVRIVGPSVPAREKDLQESDSFTVWKYENAGGRFLQASRSETSGGRSEYFIWSQDGRLIRRFSCSLPPERNRTAQPALSPDGRSLAVQTENLQGIMLYETATGRRRGQLRAPNAIHSCDFAPDGKTLATSCADTSILIWHLHRPLGPRSALPLPRNLAECERLYEALGDPDPEAADSALWALVGAPEQAVPMLRQRLQPVRAPEPARLQALLAQLDSNTFQQREAASRELMHLHEAVRPALLAALKKANASAESRRRVEQLLARLDDPAVAPPCLRELRAIEVLERIGDTESRQVLESLAAGLSEALLTGEAALALRRLRGER